MDTTNANSPNMGEDGAAVNEIHIAAPGAFPPFADAMNALRRLAEVQHVVMWPLPATAPSVRQRRFGGPVPIAAPLTELEARIERVRKVTKGVGDDRAAITLQRQRIACEMVTAATHGGCARVLLVHSIDARGCCTCDYQKEKAYRVENGADMSLDDPSRCGMKGKHPVGQKWSESAFADPAKVERLLTERPYGSYQNWGVAIGPDDLIMVVDYDGPEGIATYERQVADGTMPRTVVTITGSGGYHAYLRTPEGWLIKNSVKAIADMPGVDIRGEGGFVVCAGSIHHTGNEYRYLDDHSFVDVPIADASQSMLEAAFFATKEWRKTPEGKEPPPGTKAYEALHAAAASPATREADGRKKGGTAARPGSAARVGGSSWESWLLLIGDDTAAGQAGAFDTPINQTALAYYGAGNLDDGVIKDAIRAVVHAHGPREGGAAWESYQSDTYLDERLRKAREHVRDNPRGSVPPPAYDNLQDAETAAKGATLADAAVIAFRIGASVAIDDGARNALIAVMDKMLKTGRKPLAEAAKNGRAAVARVRRAIVARQDAEANAKRDAEREARGDVSKDQDAPDQLADMRDYVLIGEKGGLVAYPSRGGYKYLSLPGFEILHELDPPIVQAVIGDDGKEKEIRTPRAEAWRFDPATPRVHEMGFWPHNRPVSYSAPDVIAPSFIPLLNKRKALNVYHGLAITPKPGSAKRAKHLIRTILAGGSDEEERKLRKAGRIAEADKLANEADERAYYIWAWLAYNVQHIGNLRAKLPVWLVFQGKHGAGKSSLFEVVCSMFGRHGLTISKSNLLTGQFNGALAEAVFVLAEEAFYSKDPRIKGPLKDLITGRGMMLERKGIDAVPVENFCFGVMCSNEEDAVPMEDGERRFAIFRVSDRYAKKANDGSPETERHNRRCRAYWTAFRAWADSPDGPAALLDNLLQWQPEGADWSFLHDVPSTKEGHEAAARALPPLQKAILALIHYGKLGGAEAFDDTAVWLPTAGQSSRLIETEDLTKAIREWAEQNCDYRAVRDHPVTSQSVGMALVKMLPALEPSPDNNKRGRLFEPSAEMRVKLVNNPTWRAFLDGLAKSEGF